MISKVLVIEDDEALRRSIVQTLELEGLDPIPTSSFIQARRSIRSNFAGILLSDIKMPDNDGFDVLRFAQGIDPDLPVVLLTAHSDVPTAMRAMKDGAYDYLEKPCETDDLIDAVRRALAHRDLVLRNRAIERVLDRNDLTVLHFPGQSASAKQLRKTLKVAAKVRSHVHIWGETGLAKRTAAYAINRLRDQESPFVAINCATTDPDDIIDLIPQASTYDLSLKNIEAATPTFLEVLKEATKGKNVCFLTSSTRSGVDLARTQQLPHTQSHTEIFMAPLSSRREDMLDIFETTLRQAARANNIDMPLINSDIVEEVAERKWKGNLPELRQFATEVLQVTPQTEGNGSLTDRIERYEMKLIENALKDANGRVAEVAASLDIPRNTLYDRMTKFGLVAKDFRK